jgi:hypothetical protein
MKTKVRVEILLLGEKPSRGCKPFGVPALPHFLSTNPISSPTACLKNTMKEVSHVSYFCSHEMTAEEQK